MRAYRFLLPAVALAAAACSPTLDWRELHPRGSGAQLLFPCKPQSHTRTLQLAGASVSLSLHACNAGDMTFALAAADVGDAARVPAALQELREAAQRNLGGGGQPLGMPRIQGMTPQPQAQRVRVQGRMPDGSAVQEQVLVFARDTRVYQASVLGAALDAEAVETFFSSIRLGS
jgi:hypothetical protein